MKNYSKSEIYHKKNINIGHNTFIGPDVEIGENTSVGHNTVIDGRVIIGENNKIGSNTVIHGNTIIGDNNIISDFVSIGVISQHATKKYEFNKEMDISNKWIKIGNNNVLREFITVHLPTLDLTEIKNNCYIMAYNHISHDTRIYDNVIMANNAQIGGHTSILPGAYIGLSTTIHPRTTIGSYAILGMGAVVTKDILPFTMAFGSPAKPVSLNIRGLERNNFSVDQIEFLKNLYLTLKKEKEISKEKIIAMINDPEIKNHFKLFFDVQKKERKIAKLSEMEV